jgi:hypothetical protein
MNQGSADIALPYEAGDRVCQARRGGELSWPSVQLEVPVATQSADLILRTKQVAVWLSLWSS